MAQLTAYFEILQTLYLNKETFLLPHYLTKELGASFYFYYGQSSDILPIPDEYRGAHFHNFQHKRINRWTMLYDMFRCIILKARKTDYVFFIHISSTIMLISLIYKLLNSKGKIIVRADMEKDLAELNASHNFVLSKGIKGYIKKKLTSFFFNNAIVTVGDPDAFHAFQTMYKRNGWTQLINIHPALDIELLNNYGLQTREFNQKENIFLYVGRIGNYQKNTDMLLDAIEQIDLKDWKFYMVGPLTNNFDLREKSTYSTRIEQLYKRRPDLKDKVIFTGTISNFKELFEYYIRAKVFVLSSRHEGFSNALSEAAALGCYIVSTDVGGAKVVSNNWTFGSKVKQEDSKDLAKILTSIVNEEIEMNPQKRLKEELLTWDYMIKRVTNYLQ